MRRSPWHLHVYQSQATDRIRRNTGPRTKDQNMFSTVPRHPVGQPDLLSKIMNVRTVQEPAIQDFRKPRSSDGENRDDFPLIDG